MPRVPAVTNASAISPEIELLLCVARKKVPPEGVGRIQALLRGEIAWDKLIEIAHMHGVLPLLYWHLGASCLEEVPDAALAQLKDCFYSNAAHIVFLTGELCSLLYVLEMEGIPATPIKGPVLAASVYGNTLLRQTSDLDILIRKQDALRARDLLLHMDYLPRVPLTKERIAAELKFNHGFGLVRKDGKALIELQWDITRRFISSPIDTDGLWGRLQEATLDGKTVPNLGTEDLLLVLCVHGTKHCWYRLVWICDVAELIRGNELDWKWVLDEASRHDGMRMLSLGLLLAKDLMGVALPQEVMRCIWMDRVAKSLAREVCTRFFKGVHEATGTLNSPPGLAIYFNIKSRQRIQDKVRCLFSYLTTPTMNDRRLLPLPHSLSFLHYAMRPLRLIGKLMAHRLGSVGRAGKRNGKAAGAQRRQSAATGGV